MLTVPGIQLQELEARRKKLLEMIDDRNINGVVLFDRDYILYYTGFAYIPTERPIAFVMNKLGETGMFVPRLEVEHAKSMAAIDKIGHYLEYPFDPHPIHILGMMLADMGINNRIGADHDGYPWVFGYRGEPLSTLTGAQIHHIAGLIEDQMMVKSDAEIRLIRESCTWANLAHTLLQRYTRPGLTETEVSQRAGNEATRAMLDAIGPIYRAQSAFSGGAMAGYRGQIGRNAAIPHALANNITFRPGDVLVTGANAPVWGYNSELERTMIIGEPTDSQKRMFNHMVALQDIALATIGPGKPCSEVDRAVRSYYEDNELFDFWKHHVGHAIGIRYHEAPFLDLGDDTVMLPGMVFTVEPGLYSSDLGGFRHSDTVLITDDGLEMLTYYPRDLDSLTIPA